MFVIASFSSEINPIKHPFGSVNSKSFRFLCLCVASYPLSILSALCHLNFFWILYLFFADINSFFLYKIGQFIVCALICATHDQKANACHHAIHQSQILLRPVCMKTSISPFWCFIILCAFVKFPECPPVLHSSRCLSWSLELHLLRLHSCVYMQQIL